jgi:UDP:flavonoid glycosyltransferase YjiC (YdhE family)
MHARRCAEIGSAISLDRDSLTAEHVRDATQSVLHDSNYRKHAQLLADEIAELPDSAAAVALIERIVGNRT